MNHKRPADLHKVEPIAAVNINGMVILIGSIAINLMKYYCMSILRMRIEL